MRNPNEDHHESIEERLKRALKLKDGRRAPGDEVTFAVGELVEVKGCEYRIANIDRKSLMLVPVKPSGNGGSR